MKLVQLLLPLLTTSQHLPQPPLQLLFHIYYHQVAIMTLIHKATTQRESERERCAKISQKSHQCSTQATLIPFPPAKTHKLFKAPLKWKQFMQLWSTKLIHATLHYWRRRALAPHAHITNLYIRRSTSFIQSHQTTTVDQCLATQLTDTIPKRFEFLS